MKEKLPFDPEDAGFRTELIGNLKLDPESEESKNLINEWLVKNDIREEQGVLDRFTRAHEEAELYLEAEAYEAAVWVMKTALVEALEQDKLEEIAYFRQKLSDLGEDPNDLDEIYNG
jgi:hypothetical protein